MIAGIENAVMMVGVIDRSWKLKLTAGPNQGCAKMPIHRPERHRTEQSGWLRAAVLGANDGILSTASLVLGVAAAHGSHSNVLIAGIAGVPGGIRTDEKGNLYVTANGLVIYGADGKRLHVMEMHGRASNCGFGELDLGTLFVTSGSTVYRLRMDVRGAY